MSTKKETTFCTHKGYNTVAPCDDSCFSTKKEKCELCKHETPCPHSRIDNMMGKALQSESIEWEKDFDERFTLTLFGSGIGEPIFPHGLTPKEIKDFIAQAITTAVAKDRELGNPYNSVSTWKEIGKNRGYWGFFKDQVISAREKELVEEVEKKSFRGFAPYEQDYLIKKEDVLSILKH